MINWGAVKPQGGPTPGQEVASIGGLLSAIVERRQKAIEFQQQQELAVRRQEQEVRHQTELEQYNRDTLKQTAEHQAAALAQQKALAEQKRDEERAERSRLATPGIYKAHIGGHPEEAAMIASSVGGSSVPFRPATMPDIPNTMGFGGYPLVRTGSVPEQPPPSAPMPITPPPIEGGGLPPMISPEDRPGVGLPSMPPPPPAAPPPEPRATGPDAAGSPEGIAYFRELQAQQDAVKDKYQVNLPGAPAMFVSARADGETKRAQDVANGAAAVEQFSKTFKLDTPSKIDAFAEAKELLASGALDPKKFGEYVRKGIQFRLEEEGKDRRVRAAGAMRPPGIDPEVRKIQPFVIFNNEARQIIGKMDYLANVKDEKKLADLNAAAGGAGDNAALAAIVAGAFTKYAQGGTGVVSDNDLKVFWKAIGGLETRTWQAFQDAWDGSLGDEKKAIVQNALKTMQANSGKNYARMGEALVNGIGLMPGGEAHLPRILKTYTPGYYPVWMEERSKKGPAIDEDRLSKAEGKLGKK